MSLADSFQYASKGQLGVYFSNNGFTVNHAHNLPYTPQVIVSPNQFVNDKVNWMEFNMEYKATGGERYLTIGNFNDTMSIDTQYVAGGGKMNNPYSATYYYIDDVWLSHCDSVVGIEDEEWRMENVELWPNPTNSLINIETDRRLKHIFIYNVQGQIIKELKQPAKQFELPEAQGVYFLRIELESGAFVNRKVVKK